MSWLHKAMEQVRDIHGEQLDLEDSLASLEEGIAELSEDLKEAEAEDDIPEATIEDKNPSAREELELELKTALDHVAKLRSILAQTDYVIELFLGTDRYL